MLKRAMIFTLACGAVAIVYRGDARANKLLRIQGIEIECCSHLQSTVVVEKLQPRAFRIIEYFNLVGTAICRHNNSGELVGMAAFGPEGKIKHTADFVEIEDLDGEFERTRNIGESVTSGEILDHFTAAEVCPNDVSFTLEDFDLDALSYVDSIHVCTKFSNKTDTCLQTEVEDVLSGDCTWSDGSKLAVCSEFNEHF